MASASMPNVGNAMAGTVNGACLNSVAIMPAKPNTTSATTSTKNVKRMAVA